MLDNISSIFENMNDLMRKLKKKNYEANMKFFKETYGHYFEEMRDYIAAGSDKDAAAKDIADLFCEESAKIFKNKRGRVSARDQVDTNMFMIYYVFPAIQLYDLENGILLCDNLKDKWNETFKQQIGYTDYQKIHDNFREKIFGIF